MIDITNQRFGKLTVVKKIPEAKDKWLCKCDCGKEKITNGYSMRKRGTKSCGCICRAIKRNNNKGFYNTFTEEFLIQRHKENKQSLRSIAKEYGCSLGCVMNYIRKFKIQPNEPFYDIVGKKYGRLTVISFSHTQKGNSYWHTECDCGSKKIVHGRSMVNGETVSCGCYNRDKDWEGCGNLSKQYWSSVIRCAKKRNMPINITIEYAWNLFVKQDGKCALSGVEIVLDRGLSQTGKKRSKDITVKKIQTASLDRIDSSLGYVEGNVQWTHWFINRMKSSLNENQFIELCCQVSKYRGTQPNSTESATTTV